MKFLEDRPYSSCFCLLLLNVIYGHLASFKLKYLSIDSIRNISLYFLHA